MDVRRTCFVEPWFFGQGDDTAASVRWYVAPVGARCYPTFHAFGCLDWWDGLSPLAARPGPVQFERGTYDKGTTNPEFKGQSACGSVDWYQNGVPSPVPPSPPRDPSGYPFCCGNTAGGAFTITGSSDAEFAWFPAGLSISSLWTAYATSPPLNLFSPSVPLGPRCLVAGITAASSVAASLTLTVQPGWQILQSKSVGVIAHWLCLYVGAPLTSVTPMFTVVGGLAQVVGTLVSLVGVMNEGAVNVSDIATFPAFFAPTNCVGPIPNYPVYEALFFYGFVPQPSSFIGCLGLGCYTYRVANVVSNFVDSFFINNGKQICAEEFVGASSTIIGSAIAVAAFQQPNSFGLFNVAGSGDFEPHCVAEDSADFSIAGSVAVAFAGNALGPSPTDFAIVGSAAVSIDASAGTPSSFAIAGSASLSLSAAGIAKGHYAITAPATVAAASAFTLPWTLIGTAHTSSGGTTLTISGVTLNDGDVLFVAGASDSTAPTSCTWNGNSLSVGTSGNNTTGIVHFGSTEFYYQVPTGFGGTGNIVWTHSATNAYLIAVSVSGMSTAGLYLANTAANSGTTFNLGTSLNFAVAPPGAALAFAVSQLADNGTNTQGSWASPWSLSVKLTSNTGGVDLWCELSLIGIKPGTQLLALKTGATGSRHIASATAYH